MQASTLWEELEGVWMSLSSPPKRILCRSRAILLCHKGARIEVLGTHHYGNLQRQPNRGIRALESCRAPRGLQSCCILTSHLSSSHGLHTALKVPAELSALEGGAVPTHGSPQGQHVRYLPLKSTADGPSHHRVGSHSLQRC